MDLYRREEKIKRIKLKFREECNRCFTLVEQFERCLRLNNYSTSRIEKYWNHLRAIHGLINRCFETLAKKDIEDFVMKIDSNSRWSEWIKYDYKRIFKFFYRWMVNKTLEGEYPPEVKWIKARIKKSNERTPEQILTKEEIELMASKARNTMERAFVLCLYESACRIGEFLNMKIKDIQFDQYGRFILVSGKTGWRRIRILDYSRDLLRWLDSHPFKHDPESYVWIRPENNQRITPNFTNYLLRKLAKKAGITKNVHAHALRHARATELAKILTEQQLKVYCGWVNDSRMASVYVHLSGKDVDEALLKARGISTEIKEEQKQSTKFCPKCKEPNSYLSHFCRRCGSPLDVKAAFETEKIQELLIEYFKILGEMFPEVKEKFVEVARRKNMVHVFYLINLSEI